MNLRIAAIFLLLLSLSGCATQSPSSGSGGAGQGHYKVGQPYQINGNWYTPQEDFSYDETGVASWYGEDFHNHVTANGEIFNKNELTAAHKTLPLPTLARVTNLDNGKSIVVRINDRGPFSNSRLIDMSQRAAELLGFEQQGTAKVRVQVLADESKAIADAMNHYGTTAAPTLASAESVPLANSGSPETMQGAGVTGVETKQLDPVRTTPQIHEQLVNTKPEQTVIQMPVTGSHNLYVQAGAFGNMENAARLKQSLSSLGNVTVSDIVVNGTRFHRVRIGPVPDVEHADAILARVRQSGSTNARTVVE